MDAGSGGTSGDGGTSGSGGDPGLGGSAGGTSDDPDGGSVQFQATLTGQFVSVSASEPVWVYPCFGDGLRLGTGSGESWAPLRDDRPAASNSQHAAHVLDGTYYSDCRLSLGCDVVECQALSAIVWDVPSYDRPSLLARQLVQVGEAAVTSCDVADGGLLLSSDAGDDAGVRTVPEIESRAPSDPLSVRIVYSRSSSCSQQLTSYIPVE